VNWMRTESQTRFRVCLLLCGGTIGMIKRNGQLCPPDNPLDLVKLVPTLRTRFDIDVVPISNVDSSNLGPADWTRIANAIHDRLYGGYMGFVVAHGTDTLAYTTSAVALALGTNLHLPVVFTCAQHIPGVPYGDAEINLMRAHELCTQNFSEVVISCDSQILRGSRADKVDEKSFRAFGSPGFHEIGRFDANGIYISPLVRRRPERVEEVTFQPEFTSGEG
jgi:L-asparaginase